MAAPRSATPPLSKSGSFFVGPYTIQSMLQALDQLDINMPTSIQYFTERFDLLFENDLKTKLKVLKANAREILAKGGITPEQADKLTTTLVKPEIIQALRDKRNIDLNAGLLLVLTITLKEALNLRTEINNKCKASQALVL